MPFAAEQFDVITCQHVLPLVPDRHAALREMRRVLRPGGALGVAVWAPIEENPASSALADVVERHVSTELATWYRTGPFGYGSVHSLRADLTAAGFDVAEVVTREMPVSFSSVPLFARVYVDGPPFLETSTAERQRLLDDLTVRLSPYRRQGRLTYPTTAYLARATAPAR
jgi:SAM-dependent methyltransferase